MKTQNQSNLLITGSKGQLGLTFQKLAPNYPNLDFIFTDVEELDITNFDQLKVFTNQYSFDAIINCAAYTAVDNAESDNAKAELLNVGAPALLAQISNEKNITLIHISTDFVFDGKKTTPYIESDEANPISVYGKTKSDGEKEILSKAKNAAIFRTSWLYSEFGNNFVKTIQRLASERETLNVVADQIGTPTFATDLAETILNSIENIIQLKGVKIFHFSNEGQASWYDFAKEVVNLSNLDCTINPIASFDFPQQATRPAYSVMSKGKLKSQFQLNIPEWQKSLKDCILLLKA